MRRDGRALRLSECVAGPPPPAPPPPTRGGGGEGGGGRSPPPPPAAGGGGGGGGAPPPAATPTPAHHQPGRAGPLPLRPSHRVGGGGTRSGGLSCSPPLRSGEGPGVGAALSTVPATQPTPQFDRLRRVAMFTGPEQCGIAHYTADLVRAMP